MRNQHLGEISGAEGTFVKPWARSRAWVTSPSVGLGHVLKDR